MHSSTRRVIFLALPFLLSSAGSGLCAQSAGGSGTIQGTVVDSSGAVAPGAAVSIENPVSGHARTIQTGSAGRYQFINLPFNPYLEFRDDTDSESLGIFSIG